MPSKINPKQLAKYFDRGIMPIESHHKVSTLFVDVDEQFLIAFANMYDSKNTSYYYSLPDWLFQLFRNEI